MVKDFHINHIRLMHVHINLFNIRYRELQWADGEHVTLHPNPHTEVGKEQMAIHVASYLLFCALQGSTRVV